MVAHYKHRCALWRGRDAAVCRTYGRRTQERRATSRFQGTNTSTRNKQPQQTGNGSQTPKNKTYSAHRNQAGSKWEAKATKRANNIQIQIQLMARRADTTDHSALTLGFQP